MHKGKVQGSLRPLPCACRLWGAAKTLQQKTTLIEQLVCKNARLFASLAENQRSRKRDFSLAGHPRGNDRKTEDHALLKKTLDRLDHPGFAVDISTYISLLRYCRKTEALLDGKRVHNHIIKSGLQQDLYLGSLLVLMYSDCGALDHAHDAFNSLLLRDEFVFTLIMRAFARHDSPHHAFQTFEQMHQEGIIPNKRIFISIFCACTNRPALLEGKRMHARFLGTTFCSDIATNTALINMYNKCSNADYARWIFDSMTELDAVAWNVMIASCFQNSQGRDALQLFHHMQQQGVTPTKVTIIHVLDACGSEMSLAGGTHLHCSIMGSEVESDMMVQTAIINMYGRCGGVEYAERIFGRMTCRDEVVWSAMIAAYAQNAQVRSALQLFEQMLQEGMVSNKYILSSILSGCAIQLVPAEGKQMHARITCSGFALDVAVGNALVNLYGKIGCVEDAWKIFYKMFEHDMVSWNAMIAACAEHGQVEGACQIFDQMQQEGVMADRATFVNVLSACANQAALTVGKMIHAYIAGTDVKADLHIDNALVNMYGKCGSLDSMHAIFKEMPVKNSVSWNTVIGVYAQHGKDKDALLHFEEMQGEGIAPDSLTFTSVLSVCASQGALSEGKRLHQLFKSRGFQPDQVVGSALVSLYGKCGSLTEARKIFDSMPEHDVVVWNALITSFSQNGQCVEALELFNLMQQRRIKPTGVTFITVLSACSHVGLVDEACHHFDSMKKRYGITPVVDHYNCMIDLLGRAGRLEEAEEMLNTMSVQPTVASLMTLLGACKNLLDFVRGQRIAEKVFKIDPGNPSPYVMLSNIYATVGRGDDAVNVMKMMRDKHVKLEPDDSLNESIDGAMHEDFADYQLHFEEDACVA